jgi:hypothetical protein
MGINITREEDKMNGLFCVLVLAALAVLTLGFLFALPNERRNRKHVARDRHRYAGVPEESIYLSVYGDGFTGDRAGGFSGDCGGFGGGDCGGGF